jgi:predicted DNA-binding transcriptional regulator AlpA
MKTASCPIFGPRSTSPTRIHPGGNCFSRKPDLYRLYRLYNAYAGKEYVWGKGLEDLDNLYNPYKAVRPAKLALCHVFEEGSDKPSGGGRQRRGQSPGAKHRWERLGEGHRWKPRFPPRTPLSRRFTAWTSNTHKTWLSRRKERKRPGSQVARPLLTF